MLTRGEMVYKQCCFQTVVHGRGLGTRRVYKVEILCISQVYIYRIIIPWVILASLLTFSSLSFFGPISESCAALRVALTQEPVLVLDTVWRLCRVLLECYSKGFAFNLHLMKGTVTMITRFCLVQVPTERPLFSMLHVRMLDRQHR